MSQQLRITLFAMACLAQLLAAGLGIARHERVLREGTRYRFETAPVDPIDPFRGRYVQLSFAAEQSPLPLPPGIEDERAYALLGVDNRGYAEVTALYATPPKRGDYVRVTAYPDFRIGTTQGSRLHFPFDRFYAEEKKAPELERRYRKQTASPGTKPAYAVVRVLDGLAVLEDLHLSD